MLLPRPIALLPLLLAAGCTKEPATPRAAGDPIGLSVEASRAAITDRPLIEQDAQGFAVWALSGHDPHDWYTDPHGRRIDGQNPHRYHQGEWQFVQPVAWPATNGGYPMRFLALYPAHPEGLGAIVAHFQPEAKAGFTYTVPPTADRQVDLLAGRATTGNRPVSGVLPIRFDHLMARVDIGIIAGEQVQLELLSARVGEVAHTRSYDLTAGHWEGQAIGAACYTYFAGSWPGATAIVDDNATPNPLHPDPHTHHLMLMPQSSPGWQPAPGHGPSASAGGYIELLYRMHTDNGSVREVGFDDAADHPDNGGSVTGPLFVKAGFPLPVDSSGHFVWEAGRSYAYAVGLGTLGSCNGYILDENYYDQHGHRTDLLLLGVRDEGKRIGDKLQDGVIHIALTSELWSDRTCDTRPGSTHLAPQTLRLSAAAHTPAAQPLSLLCRDATGAPDPQRRWTLTSSDPAWLQLALSPDGSDSTATLSGQGSATVYLLLAPNFTDSLRTAQLCLDGSTAAIVGQNFDVEALAGSGTAPVGFTTYVGAFWRHDQVGERIVRFENAGTTASNRGAWRAWVAWMDSRWGEGDDILLAEGPGPASTVGTATLTDYDADAEHFPVSGSHSITGTLSNAAPTLLFRIGLSSTYHPTVDHPARYAVVMVAYGNNKSQKLFLRQGEHDDYLFTPHDQITTGNLTARDQARRFAPYNLTATPNQAVDPSGSYAAANPGRFVDYPTQAGTFFQWAETTVSPDRQHWAWPPIGTVTGWRTTPGTLWAGLRAQHETCPAGYRRPTDGAIDAYATNVAPTIANPTGITLSETRQSLWWKPVTGSANRYENTLWGYYADGYFDRRQIVNSPTGTTRAAVATGSNQVAYMGRLFFNPLPESDHYNASLFFPGAGRRSTTGVLSATGLSGHYWSSSAYSAANAWTIWIRNDNNASFEHGNKNEGRTIRCVKDDARD